LEKAYRKNSLIQNKIRESEATKHVKVGTRSGKLLNLNDPNLKSAINDVSVDQNADSHPDAT
jgi:hypothetical protein